MKLILAAVASLLCGLFLGGLGPRSELRRAERALKEAQASRECGAPTAALALGGLLAGGAPAAPPPPRFVPPPGEPDRPLEAERSSRPDGGGARPRGERFEEGFAHMKTAADVRAAQHRAAFLEQARLPVEKERLLDQIVARMNQELAAESERALSAFTAKPDRRPRDFVDVGVKLMTVYQKADDEWKAGLDPQARAAIDDTNFDLLTQIDIGAFRGVLEQFQRMEEAAQRGAR